MKKLNLGSGAFPKDGYVNVDLAAADGADVIHDLSVFPYPFADDEFDLVEAAHCLEHLPEPFAVMREIHRITKPGGTVRIWVPHFSRGFTHPEHKSGFDVTFPYYFRKDFLGGYQGVEFALEDLRLRWFAQPYLKQDRAEPARVRAPRRPRAARSTSLANASPELCSRIWCNWVGGFEEIEFRFAVVTRPRMITAREADPRVAIPAAPRAAQRTELREVLDGVLASGRYVMGRAARRVRGRARRVPRRRPLPRRRERHRRARAGAARRRLRGGRRGRRRGELRRLRLGGRTQARPARPLRRRRPGDALPLGRLARAGAHGGDEGRRRHASLRPRRRDRGDRRALRRPRDRAGRGLRPGRRRAPQRPARRRVRRRGRVQLLPDEEPRRPRRRRRGRDRRATRSPSACAGCASTAGAASTR